MPRNTLPVEAVPAAWTVMHLAAGDNDLEDLLLSDIDEMERGHNGTEQVNVLVQLDRQSRPGTWRYWIQPDSTPDEIASPVVVSTEVETDTGDWRTLANFGLWAVTCYPAENYVVIVGGHGGGWSDMDEDALDDLRNRSWDAGEPVRYIAPDDSSGDELRIAELTLALKTIRKATSRPEDPPYLNRLRLFGSDACLMQTIEVLYDLRNTAEFIVGSEDLEPGPGWPYNTVIRDLTERPYQYARMPQMLAFAWVEHFGSSYSPTGGAGADAYTSLSAINTSFLLRARNRFRTFSTIGAELLRDDPRFAQHVLEADSHGLYFGDYYVDLLLVLRNLRSELIAAELMPEVGETLGERDERYRTIRNAIDDLTEDIWPALVVANHVGSGNEGAAGISLFLLSSPEAAMFYLPIFEHNTFAASTGWHEFLLTLITTE